MELCAPRSCAQVTLPGANFRVRNTGYATRMTMMSFRASDADAASAQQWAERLGIDRSQLLRDALHRQLVRLAGEDDAARWQEIPLSEAESAIADIADWGPAEDWSDWINAEG